MDSPIDSSMKRKSEQAGAELGQAQPQLGLGLGQARIAAFKKKLS